MTPDEMERRMVEDLSAVELLAVVAKRGGGKAAPASEEWRDHIPSGYEDQIGYGQVSCSCGWDSSDEKLGWEEHIDAAERIGRA